MPHIPCAWCDKERWIELAETRWVDNERSNPVSFEDELHGVITCAKCDNKTVFRMRGNKTITFLPGKLYQGQLDDLVSEPVQDLFNEATLSLYGGAYIGCVALCRSSIEDSLAEKGAKGRDLNEKIADARRLGIITDEEVARAHAARLIARDTLHRGRKIDETEALTALRNTIDLLNYIASQKSASQPRPGSNEP